MKPETWNGDGALGTSEAAPPPLSPPAPPRVSKLRWFVHLAIMAALPVVAGTMGMASKGKGPALTHSAHGLLTVCAFELLFFGVFFGVAWFFSRANKDDLLLRWRPGFWVVPLGAVYSVAIRLAAGVVLLTVMTLFVLVTRTKGADVQNFVTHNTPHIESIVDVKALSENPAYFWLNVIVVSLVLGGLREELWRSSFLAGLRSIWPQTFGSVGGGILAAGVAAIFFGVGHIPQGSLTAALITVVGFLLGVITTLHRSIWPSVVAHGLFDSASMVLVPWAMQHLHEIQQLQHVG